MPNAAKGAKKKRSSRKKKEAPPKSRGLPAGRLASASPPAPVQRLTEAIEEDGGSVLGTYRDPLGGNWQVLAGLPIDIIEATPFQRDLSDAHVNRLVGAIEKLDRFLDPVIAVRAEQERYWTPNGSHRLAAVRRLGGKSIVALVVPEREVAYRILVLNTGKAHNLRERALEVIRMAQRLAELDDRPEREFAIEFDEPSLLTLGLCYQRKGRFSGGAYQPVLKRVEKFLALKLPKALVTRGERAGRLLALDEAVTAAVTDLKERGFKSPYLKAFVVARVNPLRFKRGAKAEFDETIDKMLRAAQRFDAAKVRADQLASAGGPPEE
ncbi:MAG: ParB N-terminal domain-containing protein [Acidobacteriota bacterium]